MAENLCLREVRFFFFFCHCAHLVKASQIKKRGCGEEGWGGRANGFPEDNISFEGPAERKAEGAEVVVVSILKESKAKAELLSSFSTSLAVVIHLGQLLTRLSLKFTSTMR